MSFQLFLKCKKDYEETLISVKGFYYKNDAQERIDKSFKNLEFAHSKLNDQQKKENPLPEKHDAETDPRPFELPDAQDHSGKEGDCIIQ